MAQNSSFKPNKIERLKANLLPANFNLESVDWQNPNETLRFYLKNYGIYNSKLRPAKWMLRLRFDGGIIKANIGHTIANITKKHNLEVIITARAQIELHNLTSQNVYPIWQELKRNDINTMQVLTDNIRAIITDPLDGYVADCKIACQPLIQELQQIFIDNPEWLGTLPRKFNTALIGRKTPSFNPWGNDLLFALAQRKDEWGFNIYIGGKNSATAQDVNIFCKANEAAAIFKAILQLYKKFGLRGSRAKTRLYHLIEELSITKIRNLIEKLYGKTLQPSGTLMMQSSQHNIDSLLPIKRYGDFGNISADALNQAASKAKDKNCILRLTPHQELWLFNPKEFIIVQPKKQTSIKGRVTACAGSHYCPLSLWDIKSDSKQLPLEMLINNGISVGFSGCLKGCGRHHHSNIGLVGLRTNAYGKTERALRIFIGSLQAPNPKPAKLLFYAVPERKIANLFNAILQDFKESNFNTFEEFTRVILDKLDQETLMFWYLLHQLNKIDTQTQKLFFNTNKDSLKEALINITQEFLDDNSAQDLIVSLSHKVWNS